MILTKKAADIDLVINFPLRRSSENAGGSFLPSASIISLAASPHHNGGIMRNLNREKSADNTVCSAFLPVKRSAGLIFPKYSIRLYIAASAVRRKSSVPMGSRHRSNISHLLPFISFPE